MLVRPPRLAPIARRRCLATLSDVLVSWHVLVLVFAVLSPDHGDQAIAVDIQERVAEAFRLDPLQHFVRADCNVSVRLERMREESPDLFDTQTEAAGDEWAQQRRRTQRGKIQVAWSKIEALGSAFGPFLELGPDELALAIGVDTPLYHQRLQVLDKTVRRATALLAQAAAFHQLTRGEAAS